MADVATDNHDRTHFGNGPPETCKPDGDQRDACFGHQRGDLVSAHPPGVEQLVLVHGDGLLVGAQLDHHVDVALPEAEAVRVAQADHALERGAHETIKAELKKNVKMCRDSVEACEGQVQAHGDLLEDSRKRVLGLEARVDTWAAKHDADVSALSASLKASQAAKAECIGKSEQSDTLIAECKKTVGQLERTVNATGAKLENTTAALEGSIKMCQDEKQKLSLIHI